MYEKQLVQYLASSAHLINGDPTCNDKPRHLKVEFRFSPRGGKNLWIHIVFTHLSPGMGQRRILILHFPEGQDHVHLAKANTLSQFQTSKRDGGNKKRTGRKSFQMVLSLGSENLSDFFRFLHSF